MILNKIKTIKKSKFINIKYVYKFDWNFILKVNISKSFWFNPNSLSNRDYFQIKYLYGEEGYWK